MMCVVCALTPEQDSTDAIWRQLKRALQTRLCRWTNYLTAALAIYITKTLRPYGHTLLFLTNPF